MLVVDPGKRYSIENIKKHRWMQAEIPKLPDSTNIGTTHELNDQILRLMQSLGIDSVKTREVPINFFIVFLGVTHHKTYLKDNKFLFFSLFVAEVTIITRPFITFY